MDYLLHLLIIICIYVSLTVSLDLLIGHTGILSFGHAAFYGIGAYTAAILTVYFGWNWFPALVAAFIVGLVFAALIGIPTLRLGGDYFILALFGFQSIVTSLILNWESLTNGPFGIRGVPRPSFGSYELRSGLQFLCFAAVMTLLVLVVHWRLVTSPLRSMLHAVRDDETVAMSLGINVVRTKILVFAIGGGFAAMTGAVSAFYLRFVDVSSFVLATIILLWAMVFVGGSRSLVGAVVGPVILLLFPEIFRFVGDTGLNIAYVQETLYGLLLVLLMLFRPQGLVGRKREG